LAKYTDFRIQSDTAFRLACLSGNSDVVDFCIRKGSDINVCHGQALRYACLYEHLDVVSKLLKAGADPNADHHKALITASRQGQMEVLKLLLQHGADPNPGILPAIKKNHPEVVQILIEFGAVLSQEDCKKALEKIPIKKRKALTDILPRIS
jgi:uncharacterized protein